MGFNTAGAPYSTNSFKMPKLGACPMQNLYGY
jgi:hypothetical protein